MGTVVTLKGHADRQTNGARREKRRRILPNVGQRVHQAEIILFPGVRIEYNQAQTQNGEAQSTNTPRP